VINLKEALRNAQLFVGSTTNYKKNGDAYPVQWNIYPVLDDNGVTEFFVSIQKDLSVLKKTLTSLKSSSEHFKKFLSQISVAHKKHRDEIKIEELDVADITMALKANVELLSEYANLLDSDDDDDDDDFDIFDFDDDATSVNHTMENVEKISSADYLRNTDISEEQISEIRNAVLSTKKMVTLFELEYFSEEERAEFIHDLHEIANAMFFLEEFIDISGTLGELTVVMIERQQMSFDLMTAESLKGLIIDLDTWSLDIFETKTSSDIHWLDNSIIGSCKQLLVFLRLSEKVK